MNKNKINKKQLKDFGIFIGISFPLFIGLIIPLIFGHKFREWTLFISIPFIALAFIRPYLLFYPYKLWMFIGKMLGWLNSKLILGLIFIIVVQPISFFMKLFGYDPLRTKFLNSSSYREIRKNYKIDFERIF